MKISYKVKSDCYTQQFSYCFLRKRFQFVLTMGNNARDTQQKSYSTYRPCLRTHQERVKIDLNKLLQRYGLVIGITNTLIHVENTYCT